MKPSLLKVFHAYLATTLIVVMALVALIPLSRLLTGGRGIPLPALLPFALGAPLILFGIFFVIGIGVAVYKDASERGMPPLLWALVAALVPYFIGIIAYLIVRQQPRSLCPKCGVPINAGSAFCVHCGHALALPCPACAKTVEAAAHFCPHCGRAMGAAAHTNDPVD